MIDYVMSEKFGLDWQEMDSARALYFISIIKAESDFYERESKKHN